MASYEVGCFSVFDEVTDVSTWEAESDYSESGLESTSRSTPYSGFERERIHAFAYPDKASPRSLVQAAPCDTAHQGTKCSYNSNFQFNSGCYCDGNSSYATAGINGYEHDDEHNCDDDDCVDYNVELPNSDGVKDEINRGFGSHYAGFYHVEAMGSAVMRGHEHEPDFEHYNAVSSADLCDHSNVGQPEFDSRLESCVKEHEDMCRAMNLLMHKMNRFIEKEKRKKEEASLLCVEQRRLASDVVVTKEQTSTEMEVHLAASIPVLEEKQCSDETVFVNDQKLAGVEMEWIDSAGCMIGHELAENKNNLLREVSDEKEGKTEPSVCLDNARRCLEIQREFWAIGSSFSVIPAVPRHQFVDPFLECVESKMQLRHSIIGPLEENDTEAIMARELLDLECSNFHLETWIEWFREEDTELVLPVWFSS